MFLAMAHLAVVDSHSVLVAPSSTTSIAVATHTISRQRLLSSSFRRKALPVTIILLWLMVVVVVIVTVSGGCVGDIRLFRRQRG